MKYILSLFKKLKRIITNEYYVSIDYYFYSSIQVTYMIALKLKFNHNPVIIKLSDLQLNHSLLDQLSPYNNYILGQLFKYQHNNIFDTCVYQCIDYSPHTNNNILLIDKIDFSSNTLQLKHAYSNKLVIISFHNIITNLLFINALSRKEAFDIGYRTTII